MRSLPQWRSSGVAAVPRIRGVSHPNGSTSVLVICQAKALQSFATIQRKAPQAYAKPKQLKARTPLALKQQTENDQEDVVLNPDINDTTLGIVYDQIADYMVQLSELDFIGIGAISEDPASNTWSVTRRPLTYNMNELATVSGYPIDKFPTAQFASVNEYFQNLANEHLIHLRTQRNLADDPEDAQKRFIARHRFKQLIPQYR